jgi:hypothetical protein
MAPREAATDRLATEESKFQAMIQAEQFLFQIQEKDVTNLDKKMKFFTRFASPWGCLRV